MASRRDAHRDLTQLPRNRPGEGSSSISVTVQPFIATDGRSVSQLGMDLSQARVPDRRYAADTCAVSYANQLVRIIFGQERLDGAGLRSAVIVKMAPRAVVQLLEIIDGSVLQTIEQATHGEGVIAQALALPNLEPSQAVVLAANLALPAVSGAEACVDFYQASPFAFGVAMRSHKLEIEDVARVDLYTGLFLSLVAGLKDVAAKFENVEIWKPS